MRSAGVFLAAAALCLGFSLQGSAQGFTLPIVVSSGAENAHDVELTIGMHKNASDEYDEGIDIFAPPVAPGGLDARLRFEMEDYFTDIRALDFREKAFDVLYRGYDESEPFFMRWDSEGLAEIGSFEIVDAINGSYFGPVDMTTTDSLSISDGEGYLRDGLRIRVKLSDTHTSVDEPDELPQAVALDQNYPNPFNPQTTIGFHLDSPAQVTLTVYNVLGRPVATLLQEAPRSAGSHEVVFRAHDLPSGVYLYELEGSGVRRVRQMLLQK